MKKSRTLRQYIWIYFMIFTILILILLWVFQFFFLNNYYKRVKIDEIKYSAGLISQAYNKPNFDDVVEKVAYSSNSCVIVTDEIGRLVTSIEMMPGSCILHKDSGVELFGYRTQLCESKSGTLEVFKDDSETNTSMYVYAEIIGTPKNISGFIFLNCSLEPVKTTTEIIKKQLIYITIIIIELAFIITMYISKRLSSPIVKITKDAQEFAKGNYRISFNSGDYLEIQKLSEALNYAGTEIAKVDELRRSLISNVSHDLRTPLTIIKGYAEMIRDISGDNKEKRNQQIETIISETDRLSGIVNELLELSRYENNSTTLSLSTFSLNEFINDIMRRYKVYEERDGYIFNLALDEDRQIIADKQKLEQVMYNLINNAVNYTGEDKKIFIKQINHSHCTRIEITDTGKGVSKEDLPKIFQRYYREKTYEREIVGTGLGLSIVKEILELHKFRFGVISELGNGSTFWFEIPLTKSNALTKSKDIK